MRFQYQEDVMRGEQWIRLHDASYKVTAYRMRAQRCAIVQFVVLSNRYTHRHVSLWIRFPRLLHVDDGQINNCCI